MGDSRHTQNIQINQVIGENEKYALAGVAQCIERGPVTQRVTGSIPRQGTCLGCGPGTQ